MASASIPLHTRLAQALPASLHLLVHHIVSDTIPSPELFSAPPGELPENTTSESHFLSVSIRHDGKVVQVFALEIYVYTTSNLTTIFVSKADSTGYLELLDKPKDTSSPIRTVITTFLDWLVESKRRKDARLLLSLFARAQNQYLFPGSVENTGKHVLDDRGLIRWWCRVLDPILQRYHDLEPESDYSAHAHLIVPGLDAYETRPLFPRSSETAQRQKPRWSANDPLQALGKPADLPTRCYIPRFPDDPKARFVIDLDDELPDEAEDASKGRSPGLWRSVKTLSGFWELMAFRQECGAGRLVGFIWAVFEPAGLVDKPLQARLETDSDEGEEPTLPTPLDSQHQIPQPFAPNNALSSPSLQPLGDGLLSPVSSSQPQTTNNSADESLQTNGSQDVKLQPVVRGKRTESGIQLSDEAYKKCLLLLDTLDYAGLDTAIESTSRFLTTVSDAADIKEDWALEVIGAKAAAPLIVSTSHSTNDNAGTTPVNVISVGLVRSKKRSAGADEAASRPTSIATPEVRVLSSSMVRKKPKV